MAGNSGTELATTTETWQYTWESQSHTPTLRLLLFIATDRNVSPSTLQCHNLSVNLLLSRSVLVVTWSDSDAADDGTTTTPVSVRVPVPRAALVDGESLVSFRALADHIEVKLRLLLPVDHPILSGFDSVLNLPEEPPCPLPDGSRPLVMESDVKSLSSRGGVDFYCRRCSFKLNRYPLKNFVEMPSANWREVADNWFGACCCSFGGISEKLVIKYASSYSCSQGLCLLSSTSVTLCKDDLVDYNFPEVCELQGCNFVADNPGDGNVSKATVNSGLPKESTSTCSGTGEVTCTSDKNSRFALPENEKLCMNFRYEVTKNERDNGDFSNSRPDSNGDGNVSKATVNSGLPKESTSTCSGTGEVTCTSDKNSRFALPENEKLCMNFRYEVTKNERDNGDFSNSRPDSNGAEGVGITPSCCVHKTSVLGDEHSEHHLSETARKEWMLTEAMEILGSQKSFLNGFLEDIFIARSSNLSNDIDWHEFTCPQCASLLGVYPCCEGRAPVDGGVRLFKCYISNGMPVGGSGDLFSKYTMDRMFANQLVQCANDESSFRFVVRDLKTKSPVLQVVLLNPDTWSCFGNCSATEDEDLVPKLQLQPIVKVLFSHCSTATETQIRVIEEWATKNSAENIFMLTHQIQELVRSLMSAKDKYPPSCASFQSLILSSLQR